MKTNFTNLKTLIFSFFKENKSVILSLIIISTILSILQTNGISIITSQLIQHITEQKNISLIQSSFFYLVVFCIIHQLFTNVYYKIRNGFVIKLKSWVKYQLVHNLFQNNYEKYHDENHILYNTPIHRISNIFSYIFSDIISYLLPNVIYIIIVFFYFCRINLFFSFVFLTFNVFIFYYIFNYTKHIIQESIEFEKLDTSIDDEIVELLNNFKKIISRSNIHEEDKTFKHVVEKGMEADYKYREDVLQTVSFLRNVNMSIMLLSIAFLIYFYHTKTCNISTTIAGITILIIFREKIRELINQIPSIFTSLGRSVVAVDKFEKHLIEEKKQNYESHKLPFKVLFFDNISFFHEKKKKAIFNNFSLKLQLRNIIGIVGPSGKGKSTLAKMIIKLHQPTQGNMYMDNVNYNTLNPFYLRDNIVYVSYVNPLFNKGIYSNLIYGCKNISYCENLLNKIMKNKFLRSYLQQIQENMKSNSLSGGEKQMVNLINGLIIPSKILILDEPTNGLDSKLKDHVINMIDSFKNEKQCIIIISHDKQITHIFDKTIHL